MKPELFIPHTSEIQLERTDFVEGYTNSGAATLETYVYFEGDKDQRAAQRTDFLAGEVRNPVLNDCPRMERQRTDRRDQFNTVTTLAKTMDSMSELGVRDKAVLDLLARRSDEIAYLEAAWHLSTLEAADPLREQYAALIRKMGRELFGKPDEEEFTALTTSLRAQAEGFLSSSNAVTWQISREFLELSGPMKHPAVEVFTPRQETLNWYNQRLHDRFDSVFEAIFSDIPNDTLFTPDDMVEYFNRALTELGYSEWKAVKNPDSMTVEARQSQQELMVGAGRVPATLDDMKRLIIHEVGVHIGRRVNGSKLDDGLLGLGLSGYPEFEEGFAVALEEAYKGNYGNRGTQYTFALGIAMGMDGESERDFRDTFELQWRRNALQKAKSGNLTDEMVAAARLTAYNQCVRVWRGMPTEVPGCVYPKDMAYSNARVWQYLEKNVGNEIILQYLLQGKFNPLRSDHVEVVATYAS